MAQRSGSKAGFFFTQWFGWAPRAQRLQSARQKAEDYHPLSEECPQVDPQQESVRPQKSEEEWGDLVSRRIEEAMREGAFDNLPGRGKPLDLGREAFVPEDQQMAFKLLQNNDLSPAWIGERNELHGRINSVRARLARALAQHHRELQEATTPAEAADVDARWQYQLRCFADEMRGINGRILTLNLKQPATHLEIFQLRLDEELRRLDTCLDDESSVPLGENS